MKIIVKNLEKSFGKHKALENLSVRFEKGIYGILAPNGAGKTTLLRCITGIYEPENGAIGFVDAQGELCSPKANTIGYLPQKFGIFKNMSVRDFMLYFAQMKGIEKSRQEMEMEKCLQLVNLEDCIKKKVKKLSGGMVRRLGIAQALLGNPEILIFDEPTTGLDPEERMRFKRILAQLGKETIIIISTHIVEDIEAVCDKVIIMKHGKKVLEESTKKITNHMKSYIYELNEADLNNVKSDYRILKIYNKNNLLTNRIMSREKLQYEEVEAVLEDVYYEYVSWEE